MPTTPNSIHLESVLRHCLAHLDSNAESPGSDRREELEEALATFRSTRAETDRAYLNWRDLHHDTIRAHKAIRLAYADVRQNCLEWGLEEYPDRFISYIDQEETQEAAEEMVAYLETVEDLGDDWVAKAVERLKRVVDEAGDAVGSENELLRDYRIASRTRKVGYEHAYGVARAFFEAVKHTLSQDTPEYYQLSVHFF